MDDEIGCYTQAQAAVVERILTDAATADCEAAAVLAAANIEAASTTPAVADSETASTTAAAANSEAHPSTLSTSAGTAVDRRSTAATTRR